MPPTGGFGLNTGVQDVHNLAWKLAAVLQGAAGAALLDTYHAERQPLGRAITEQSLANALSMGRTARQSRRRRRAARIPQRAGADLRRHLHARRAVVPDGTPPPAVANPGHRLRAVRPPRWPRAACLAAARRRARSRPSTCSARASRCWPAPRRAAWIGGRRRALARRKSAAGLQPRQRASRTYGIKRRRGAGAARRQSLAQPARAARELAKRKRYDGELAASVGAA